MWLDHFLNPAHSTYQPGYPLSISIERAVHTWLLDLHHFGIRFLGRTLGVQAAERKLATYLSSLPFSLFSASFFLPLIPLSLLPIPPSPPSHSSLPPLPPPPPPLPPFRCRSLDCLAIVECLRLKLQSEESQVVLVRARRGVSFLPLLPLSFSNPSPSFSLLPFPSLSSLPFPLTFHLFCREHYSCWRLFFARTFRKSCPSWILH